MAEAEHQRAAELDAVIHAMGEAVVVCRGDGTIALTNPAARALFPGHAPATYDEVMAELDDPDAVLPGLGVAGGPIEVSLRLAADRWVEVSTYPVTGGPALVPDGETLVVMRDITEARRREAVRETFIGVLSHELRTPVTTIYGGAKLLARDGSALDEDMRRSVFADIYEEAERLQRLVEDIVALNRFGETAQDIGSEPVLLQRLLPRIAMSEGTRWPGVTFAVGLPADLPTVAADETYVEQVVRNLLSNGAKYGGSGSTVQIESIANGQEVEVRILDDGPGLAPDEADRLFELFYRSPRTAMVAGGAGIGLFVCARLVAAMGGRIWAAPRPTGGAEFGFALRRFDD
jgi:two-component system phosphate regulon sensor histidine kinase PhoR